MTEPYGLIREPEITIGTIRVRAEQDEDSGPGWRWVAKDKALLLSGLGTRDEPAPAIRAAGDFSIVLMDGSENYLTASGEENAALDVNGGMIIQGGGSLSVNYPDPLGIGICTTGKLLLHDRAAVSGELRVHHPIKQMKSGRQGVFRLLKPVADRPSSGITIVGKHFPSPNMSMAEYMTAIQC